MKDVPEFEGFVRPGAFDLVAKKKYAAWEEIKGTSSDAAMQLYIDEVQSLLEEE